MRGKHAGLVGLLLAVVLLIHTSPAVGGYPSAHVLAAHREAKTCPPHKEVPRDPPASRSLLRQRATEPARSWSKGPYTSVQVNVDAFGGNIVDDAANEPTLAIDPTDPSKMAIGWRQFDHITSNHREAGVAYSHDGGQTWTFPGALDDGVFRSDPVLAADPDGNFYYNSLTHDPVDDSFVCHVFKSTDGGVNWLPYVYAYGGDKQWMAIDPRSGPVGGNIYAYWTVYYSCCPPNNFTRSVSAGAVFETILAMPQPSMYWGTLDVGPDGELYVAGVDSSTGWHAVAKSTNAQDPSEVPAFEGVDGFVNSVSLGGYTDASGGPNPGGLLGQVWVATDHSTGPTRGNVYMLSSVVPDTGDPLDIMFTRSTDGGLTWSSPIRVNDDPTGNGAWQWFGTMSVAPNGRIDTVWADTRKMGQDNLSEVYYSYSTDAGVRWSANIPISFVFDSWVGWPKQNKLGDYYHMVSDNDGANLAYAATFNGEQDVYFVRIEGDCNNNGIDDDCDVDCGSLGGRCYGVLHCGEKPDCNSNNIPDECEPDEDCNDNQIQDVCDIANQTSDDCNWNDIPDECELVDNDCNGNEIPDECELAGNDCNDNSVPDECDIASEASADCQPDGVPDDCQLMGAVIPADIGPCSPTAADGQTWCDDFESYSLGTISGPNWEGWEGNPGALGVVSNEQNHTQGGSQSLKIEQNDDTVRLFHGYDLAESPLWVLRAWIYIPSGMSGSAYLIALSDYGVGGTYWSVQLQMDSSTIYCYGTGTSLPLLTNQWVPIRLEIDLLEDSVAVFYNDTSLGTHDWTIGGGSLNLAAIDLYGPGTSGFYFDDMELFVPYTTDINGNGVPDECEDCNENILPDECDLDCAAAGGLCNLSGCGLSKDADTDGILDECECDVMALIPGGEFEMGDHQGVGQPDELPTNAVYVSPFYMDIYEVTNQCYAEALNWAWANAYIDDPDDHGGVVYDSEGSTVYCDTMTSSSYSRIIWNGSSFGATPSKEDHPVVLVSWYGAVAYANWRSAQDGRDPCYNLSTWECDFDANGYRLPTEAEWEYAARGGLHPECTQAPYCRYPWGDTINGSKANYSGSGDPFEGASPETTPVSYYDGNQIPAGPDMANGYGLYDMAGDVYDWCNDWYDPDYYSLPPSYDNPRGPASGDYRVLRVGSWDNDDYHQRCANRGSYSPDVRNYGFGLRLVRPIDPPGEPEGEAGFEKNRYISFVPGNPGELTALRVTLTSMPADPPHYDFTGFEGTQVWVSDPIEVCENSGQDDQQAPNNCGVAWTPDGPKLTMWSANLQADQYCYDFGSIDDVLHVTDCEIVPGATYTVAAIPCGADPAVEGNYSDPLVIYTSMWGDICNTFDGAHWTAPNGTVDVTLDVTACLEKFKNAQGAPIKARADVAGNVPEWKVGVTTDVTRILDAFRGQPYPFAGPGTCP